MLIDTWKKVIWQASIIINLSVFTEPGAYAQSLCPSAPGEAAQFSVGFSQLSITPFNKLTLGGYGTYFGLKSDTRMNGEGIHDPLFSTALWLQKDAHQAVALVALDLVGLSQTTVERVEKEARRRLNRPGLEIVLAATHTHHSPDVLGLWGALPLFTGRDNGYMNFMEDAVVRSIEAASKASECAQLSWARSFKETSWHPELPSDSQEEQVLTLVATNPGSGTIIGTLSQWAAHPTLLKANNNTISSDFPGTFRYFLGQNIPGIHLYVNGMLGNSYIPVKEGEVYPDPFTAGDRDKDVSNGYDQVAYHGRDLALKVIDAVTNQRQPILSGKLAFYNHVFPFDVNNLRFNVAERLKIIEDRGLSENRTNTRISLIEVGELKIGTIPGEMFPSGSSQIRSLIHAKSPGPVMFLGIGNDWLGYLMHEEEFNDSKYKYQRDIAPHAKAVSKILTGYKNLLKNVPEN